MRINSTAAALLFFLLPTTALQAQSDSLMAIMQQTMQDMQSMQPTGDPYNDFATMLRRHHQRSIEMAQLELQQGKDAELKALAQKIITEQQKDNEELAAFLSTHKAHGNSDFGQNAKTIMSQSNMNMTMSGDVDKDFAMMMMHHEEGIKMAREYLKSGKDRKLITMANKNIKSQTDDNKKLSAKAGTTHAGHQR